MKITAIKQQVKRKDRYSVYVDGEYSFSLSENGLLVVGLRSGQELDSKALDELKNTAESDKAYSQVLNLLSRRPRSEWEVRDYLKRKGYSQYEKTIISKLKNLGYVDDEKFARAWIENRRLLKQSSRRRLQQELKQKRVNSDVIEEVLSQDNTDESDILKELITKKRRQTRYQDNQKLMQYLIRQGFNYGDVKQALEQSR